MRNKMFVSTCKRIGAALLCLSLLMGTVAIGMGAPAVADTDTVKNFRADFKDLVAQLDDSVFAYDTPANGGEDVEVDVPIQGMVHQRYTPTAEDTAVNEWMNARFAMWVNREKKFYGAKAYLGESSDAVDGGDSYAGAHRWDIGEEGALCYVTANPLGDQMLRKSSMLTVKAENGMMAKLANFEATVIYNEASKGKRGAVIVSFHEERAGQVNTKNTGNSIVGKSAIVAVGNDGSKDGVLIRDYGAGVSGNTVTAFSANTNNLQDYALTVRVVGTTLAVKVTKVKDNSLVYEKTTTVTAGSGYLSVGVSNSHRNIKSIEVTELDENGNAVDFGTATGTAYNDFYFSMTDLAPYTKAADGGNGKYPASNAHFFTFADQTSTAAKGIIDEINNKFFTYYNHDSKYVMAPAGKTLAYEGQTADKAYFGTSLLNLWLQRNTGSRTEPNTAIQRITSLVPKDKNGTAFRYRNFETSFLFRFESATAMTDGGAIIGFRQKTAGKFTTTAADLVKMQGFVLITKTGLTVMAGDTVSGSAATANAVTFTSVLPQEVRVQMRVVGNTVTVKITDIYNDVAYYTGEHTIDYDEVGCIAYGVSTRGHDIGEIRLVHLDDNGKPIDVDFSTLNETAAATNAEKFTFTATDIADFENGVYVTTGENTVGAEKLSAVEMDALNTHFNFYFNHEATYAQVAPYGNEAGKHTSGNWQLADNRWLRRVTTYGEGEYVRLINALVPKDTYGNELELTNFTASFDYKFEKVGAYASTALFGFRQLMPGRFVNGYNSMNTEQCLVAISPHSMDVAGGTDITGGRFYRTAIEGKYSSLNEVFSTTLPDEIHIEITAVGTSCKVTIFDITGATQLFSKTFTVNYTKAGAVAFGVGTVNGNVGNMQITRLDAGAGQLDIGSPESVQDCPWDTTVAPYEDTADADMENDYDFYYTSKANGTVKESMGNHWLLKDGVLWRQNDLSNNATDNTALLHWKGTDGVTALENFDASFKLHFDAAQQGTFWVTAGQREAANIGKLVTTAGADDFIKGQLAVGFAVGGDVIIATGDGTTATVKGALAGTPTGTYFVRVQVFGGKVYVFVNGVQRASRSLDASVNGAGALCFGYSGAALGMSAWQITKLDENGAPVDFTTTYTAVEAVAPVAVTVGTTYAQLEAQLPDRLNVTGTAGTESSFVFWDLTAVDLANEGQYTAIGYLSVTNGIRAAVTVRVGKYDQENTVIYDFSDTVQLENFDTYYLPETGTVNNAAIHVQNTAENNWYITKDGFMKFRPNSFVKSLAEVQEGFTLGGNTYKDKYANVCNINMGIAVLKEQKYTNFILEVDFKCDGEHWNVVGFGAQATDVSNVYWNQKGGGYTYSVYPSGSATLHGYSEALGTADILAHGGRFFDPYKAGGEMHHLKMVVSNGEAYLFVDDFTTPHQVTLPEEYNGGYIYLATNATGCYFDNLKITDLDAKALTMESVVNPPADMVVDRAAGDVLTLPSTLDMVDANGCVYPVPVKWESADYDSSKNGVYTFKAVGNLANATFADALIVEMQVENRIGNDYDADYTVKYYLDHTNDLDNFLCHYSMYEKSVDPETGKVELDANDQPVMRWSADIGELRKVEAKDYWTANGTNGATTTYIGAGGTYNERNKFRSVSSMILKDLNLVNFRLEIDFTHGSNFWYPYVLVGVQDPSKYLGTVGFFASGVSQFRYDTSLGGGVYTYLEREGVVNIHGGLADIIQHMRYSKDYGGATTLQEYSYGQQHHLTLTVLEGVLTVQVDDSALYSVKISDEALGGYIGFAGCGNGAGFKNLAVTALDPYGNEVPLSSAERGFAPDGPEKWFEGWLPTKDDYSFEWGSKYTH